MKIYRISKLVCFVIGAALLPVFKDFFIENLRWFIGGLMVLYGTLGIFETALKKEKPIYRGEGFLFFCLELLMGATVLIFIEEFSTVCVIWAAWSIFRESLEIKEIIDGAFHPALAVISAIESLAVIVLSVMLIDEPGHHHAMIHTYLLCVELVLAVLIPIINRMILKKRGKEHGTETEAIAESADTPEQPAAVETIEEAAPKEEETVVTE